jgi:hypothetical protein
MGTPPGPASICFSVLPYCSASAATSSRQKAGMSGTTRPQTECDVVEKTLEYVSDGLLGRPPKDTLFPAGVLIGVARGPQGGGGGANRGEATLEIKGCGGSRTSKYNLGDAQYRDGLACRTDSLSTTFSRCWFPVWCSSIS